MPLVGPFLLLAWSSLASAELTDLSPASLKKSKIGDLKAFLAARGQTCDGCAEKADYIAMVEQHKDDPTVSVTATPAPPTFEPPVRPGAPEPTPFDFSWADIQKKMEKGKKRVERVKQKMAKMGYDVSGIDATSLGSLADSPSFTDDQLINILASISKAGGKEGEGGEGGSPPKGGSEGAKEGGGVKEGGGGGEGEGGAAAAADATPTPTPTPAKAGGAGKKAAGSSGSKGGSKPTKLPQSTPKPSKKAGGASKGGSASKAPTPTPKAPTPKAAKDTSSPSTSSEKNPLEKEGEGEGEGAGTPTPRPKATPKWRPPPKKRPVVIEEEEPEAIDLDDEESLDDL